MRGRTIANLLAGGYLLLLVVALVATTATPDDGDGLHNLALELLALPWTFVLVLVRTPDSLYPAMLTAASAFNAALIYGAGRVRTGS